VSTPEEVRDAVVDAYYRRTMSAPESARQRAQAAYGIASALAAGIVAAGLFGGLDRRPTIVQVVAIAALAVWMIAAGLFLHAVSSPFATPPQQQVGTEAFITTALQAVRDEGACIDRWQRWAQFVSLLAAVLTVGAFGLAIKISVPAGERDATVTLSAAGAEALKATCKNATRTLSGLISNAALGSEFVEVSLDGRQCGPRQSRVAIPRSQILAVVFRGAP
jgi:hypothetical protein